MGLGQLNATQLRSLYETRRLLTEKGQNALGGQADWIKINSGIDRWLGGVHLQGQEATWRWDMQREMLVQIQGAV